jgi:protein SCO1/2
MNPKYGVKIPAVPRSPHPLDVGCWLLVVGCSLLVAAIPSHAESVETTARTYSARGVVLDIDTNTTRVVIQHEAIADYMSAMTMPFKVRDTALLTQLKRGDQTTFQLHVTADESWVDHFQKIGTVSLPEKTNRSVHVEPLAPRADKSLLDYKFTNELGQAVSFNDFRGQAIAITFFYTRCPLPDYCPRLSKNFQSASQKLQAMAGAPTNWHFLSVSFDPQYDTPQTLKSYGEFYQYDPAHWSFLTGPQNKIAALAQGSGVKYETDGGTINHNFRTLIIDPEGHLQMVFPTSGDISDQIVSEILKAADKKKSSE